MGSSGGHQSSQQTQVNRLPVWETPVAKEYLAALQNLVFPQNAPAPTPQGANQAIAGGGLDPQVAAMMAPMLQGSSYLQALGAKNPWSLSGAFSPGAANQLSSIYGPLGVG